MITVVGLGPGDYDRLPESTRSLLEDPGVTVVLRTVRHPAAERLASLREVVPCDDLYERSETFEDVYDAIAGRVADLSAKGPVVYAVPGSPLMGEFAVTRIRALRPDTRIVPGESFVDAVLATVGYDPFDRGLQILNGHDLPDPLVLDKPTIIGHLSHPEILADVSARVAAVIPEDAKVKVLVDLGTAAGRVVECEASRIDPSLAGLRTSLWVDSEPGGLLGAVRVMRVLRQECPWDREQTHKSLTKNLIEEAYELIEAISAMPDDGNDWGAYAGVEDELGDLLLQVLFHEAIAREVGAFDIDGAAETLRQKLVRRHPHVFGDVEAGSPEEVKANWDRIKAAERGDEGPRSALDGVPRGMPALHRASKVQNKAAKIGFDWPSAEGVVEKLREEMAELAEAMAGSGSVEDEMGDLLFTVVNLARHLGVDTEVALQRATDRFVRRFQAMEAEGPLEGLSLDEMNDRWERAKD
ncbi:MAG: nucleoside triphosphate pyrophosphohydrolase [Actinomycetes bacterium]|nr:MAG: nucleoside triphosphate pyrophosphohydrolase [Actinomycetota bacterium]